MLPLCAFGGDAELLLDEDEAEVDGGLILQTVRWDPRPLSPLLCEAFPLSPSTDEAWSSSDSCRFFWTLLAAYGSSAHLRFKPAFERVLGRLVMHILQFADLALFSNVHAWIEGRKVGSKGIEWWHTRIEREQRTRPCSSRPGPWH